MAEGRSNAASAAAAYLSESAISKHIKSIFSKLRPSDETLTHRRMASY
jgi:DNA-binding NarL/FixJ family response regulator